MTLWGRDEGPTQFGTEGQPSLPTAFRKSHLGVLRQPGANTSAGPTGPPPWWRQPSVGCCLPRIRTGSGPVSPRLSSRNDFRRMGLIVWLGDSVIALAGVGAAALLIQRGILMLVPLAWLFMAAFRASSERRIADLNDLQPFAGANVKFVALSAVLATLVASSVDEVRAVSVLAAALAFVGYALRWLVGRPRTRRALGLNIGENVVIVGSLMSVSRTIAEWRDVEHINVVGVCISESDFGPLDVAGIPILGSVADVAALSKEKQIDVVAVHDVDKLGGLQLAKLQWALEDVGTQLSIITPITNTIVERARVRRVGRRVMVDVAHSRPRGLVAATKSFVDRLLAVLLLVSMAPVLGVCMLLVKVTSPGPAIFKQARVRELGGEFTMYKLRTMTVDAEERLPELADLNEVGGGLFKMRDDPRVTTVGRWLRRFSLDELPQLWNVVVGDMSLIGPRPALPSEVATYDDLARRRLSVKPGLTGLWQVSGRSNLSWEETVRIDSDYVDNWRPARELAIALRTIKAVLTRTGAR
jgi:exopolysaccharide biosynthesis polyprenyl glycosylphosphotransferase